MELQIENESFLKDVQKQFNAFYPFLQLQFLKIPAAGKIVVQKSEKADPEMTVKQLVALSNSVSVSVENKVSVAYLMQQFAEVGLSVQVCRKSGNHWVETSLTDDWSLEHQNNEALLIC